MTAKKDSKGQIKVTLMRSLAKRLPNHQDCVRGLGLSRRHQTVTLQPTPEIMGLVNKVSYMLKVEQA
ncbi:MAG TPA: 50S ribosomal protein L30 [Nevskiaceae bacterium]|nr:50S ribosomal protein L30 [Nevskiaceae bacterium]